MRYKLNKGFIAQNKGRRLTIFDPEESVLYTFNETASFIFMKIKKEVDEKEIISKLEKEYRISHERAQKDVQELLGELVSKKIIRVWK